MEQFDDLLGFMIPSEYKQKIFKLWRYWKIKCVALTGNILTLMGYQILYFTDYTIHLTTRIINFETVFKLKMIIASCDQDLMTLLKSLFHKIKLTLE